MRAAISIADQPRRNTFAAAAFAVVNARVYRRSAVDMVDKRDEAVLHILQRADAIAGSTTATGWTAIVQDAFREFLVSLSPYGAAGRLIAKAVPARMGGTDEAFYPVRSTAPTVPPWVAENDPIPVTMADFDQITLGPLKKLAHIVAWSREVGRRADAAQIFGTLLRENVAAGVDAALLSSTVASSAANAGLLNGVTATSSVSSGTDIENARVDLAALAAATAANGSGDVIFVAAPERVAKLRVLLPDFMATADFAASAAVAADRVVGIDAASLLVSIDQQPDIFASEQATVHMSDTPLQIVSTAPVTADPVRDYFQTSSIGLRIIHEMAFSKRRSGAVQFLDASGW